MPFLDHLEELRSRILKALGAVVAGFAVGLWVVQRFQFVSLLKEPIAPYLQGGRLTVLSPTEPVMIVLKLALVLGLVLASPVLLWQLWAFLAPALYEQERKAVVPALVVGAVLFLTGAALGYIFVVPQALRVLFSFQSEALQPMITYDAYFGFVMQIMLALGISFELPLVIIILAVLGVVTPAGLHRFRRFAVVLSFVAGAILSPGADVLSMFMMTLPLLVLYEVGVAGTVIIHRRRVRQAAASVGVVLLLLAGGAGSALAQVPQKPRVPGKPQPAAAAGADSAQAQADSLARRRVAAGQSVDTATARRLGLPTGPTLQFAPSDSIMDALLRRPGFQVTRYRADSATLFAGEKRILLQGNAMTKRDEAVLEAGEIGYLDAGGLLQAKLSPRLFSEGNILIGRELKYYTGAKRGVVTDALTTFEESGTPWFLRGSIAQDSSSSRIYAASSEITSCDLPEPHYHFAAKEVKWISERVMVARPAVLYVRDVPVMWLPFIFQDGRPGRHSGILVPRIGINDIVRPSPGFNRQITNIGYYWAANDYFDLTTRFDWLDEHYTALELFGQYRWLDRFMEGSLGLSRQWDVSGSRSTGIRWNHRQSFSLSTSLNLSLNYISDSRIVSQNSVDPLLTTQQITSALNLSKRFQWGQLTLGGNRRQSISDNSSTTQFPALTISPKPLDIGSNVTWSPGLSFTTEWADQTPLPEQLAVSPIGGTIDSLRPKGQSRSSALNFETPVRIGDFNWRNTLRINDRETEAPRTVVRKIEDPANPGDSLTVTTTYPGDFFTGLDWDTGINLPLLFRGSWKLQPSVGITNTVSGQPFLLRNVQTGGDYVTQGKRFALSVSSAPTLFGFYPGFGPVQRIRHSFSPIIAYSWAPQASIDPDFAAAITTPGQPLVLTSDRMERLSIGLAQNLEAKRRPAPGDTSDPAQAPKFRILGLSTSPMVYDFEQARKPGRTGWANQSMTNSFQSDLLPGFSLSLTHDLWRGTVGSDTADFDPFLSSASMSFSVSSNTFRRILGAFGIGKGGEARDDVPLPGYVAESGRRARPGPEGVYSFDQGRTNLGRRFTANVSYTLSRSRPRGDLELPEQKNIGFSTSFSPTPLWALSWSTQFNATTNQFESHILRLERDLHEWRAGFNFVESANGNFSFFFSVFLTDLPAVKIDYDQTTIGN
ncbi:MAG TPA: twin-arginine translocase subunit TatC [Gemmatimonadales bacterium]|nr:twin-arginine translocase subunit TatC [Gemmatimonadales bacterium]